MDSFSEVPHANGATTVFNFSSMSVALNNPNAWLEDPEKVKQVQDLKNIAYGNARIVYGSDRAHFYDIVITHFELGTKINYAAYLALSIDGTTKALRRDLADCPLQACRALVAGLIKDTSLVFTKFDIGDRFHGQQGMRNSSGNFELFDEDDRYGSMSFGGADDSRDMDRVFAAPRGPRGYSYRGGDRWYPRGNGKRDRLDY